MFLFGEAAGATRSVRASRTGRRDAAGRFFRKPKPRGKTPTENVVPAPAVAS